MITKCGWQVWAVLGVLVAIGGCEGRAGERRDGAVVRDSASVRIVEIGDLDPPAEPLTLSDSPRWEVGWNEGDPLFEWITYGAFLSSGEVAVADSRASRVLVFSQTGDLIWELGREGEGPGEFLSISGLVALPGDSILVEDDQVGRYSVFHKGNFERSEIMAEALEARHGMRLHGLDSDGRPVLSTASFAPTFTGGWSKGAVARVEIGGRLDTIAQFDMVQDPSDHGGDPFPPAGDAAIAGSWIAVVRSDRTEVRWIDFEGRLEAITRWVQAQEALSDSVWEAYADYYRSQRSGPELQELEVRLRARRDRARGWLPFFDGVLGDSGGNAWIAEWTLPGRSPRRFAVVSQPGRYLGQIEVPNRFRILAISETQVLGVQENELGVQAVALYDMHGG